MGLRSMLLVSIALVAGAPMGAHATKPMETSSSERNPITQIPRPPFYQARAPKLRP